MLTDVHQRPLRNLRLSVTDRCNLRCSYCMPEEEYIWLQREDLLSFEELGTLVDVFMGLGVEKLRLTGGEPLLRRDLPDLVAALAAREGLREIALTTNGLRLAEAGPALLAAGLGRLTVSLDTLRPERFKVLTRRDDLQSVLAGLRAVAHSPRLKLNAVALRGVNEDELGDLVRFGREIGAEVRFIEYMDVGGANRWTPDSVVCRDRILELVGAQLGPIEALEADDPAPAGRYRLADGTVFGIVASVSAPFCSSCDRSRLTADGQWFRCLYALEGTDLRGPLRGGASRAELEALVTAGWTARADRGAEERKALARRDGSLTAEAGRDDPHLQMHTRGG
ncbi:MAG: GTP 3',8-cyclase MoaA [Planctomycetota bacterium]|jgi:cyclic pyranopterin phosphate synthase|nr:GTP 3',8-cyclase MoaA [Planctomycetota bacterium]MDP6763741.1 GTP 3',8-cyclase MoaA [Planctomycetota bacterium]MDP6989233.1 GTP 3',8-cyclase MoaA [Planctomycetota bacterium]